MGSKYTTIVTITDKTIGEKHEFDVGNHGCAVAMETVAQMMQFSFGHKYEFTIEQVKKGAKQ